MKLSEVYELIKDDLPPGVKDFKKTYYDIQFVFADSSGDIVECSVTSSGEVYMQWTHEEGCLMTSDFVQFLWRIQRMINDKPWG